MALKHYPLLLLAFELISLKFPIPCNSIEFSMERSFLLLTDNDMRHKQLHYKAFFCLVFNTSSKSVVISSVAFLGNYIS